MVMDSFADDANVTTEPISTSSSVNETFLIDATSIMAHEECDGRNAFDYYPVPKVDCNADFSECETVGMYAIIMKMYSMLKQNSKIHYRDQT